MYVQLTNSDFFRAGDGSGSGGHPAALLLKIYPMAAQAETTLNVMLLMTDNVITIAASKSTAHLYIAALNTYI